MLPDQFSNNLTEASELYKKFTRKSFQNNYFHPFVISSKAQRSINTQVSLFGTRWMPIGKHAIHYNLLKQNLKTYSCKNMDKKNKVIFFIYLFKYCIKFFVLTK